MTNTSKVNLDKLVAGFVADAIEPGVDCQTIDLAPLWAETRFAMELDAAVKLNVLNVLGHLRSFDPEQEYTYTQQKSGSMVLIVTRTDAAT